MAKMKQRALLAILFLVPLGIGGFFASRIVQFSRDMANRPRAVGEEEFLAANRQIHMNRGETAAFGNSDEARTLARLYSAAQATMHAKLFEGGRPADLSLTEGSFLVYCHLTDDACVFLVHVPQMRQYTREARAELRKRSWTAARDLLAERRVTPRHLAVALRGAVLFDSIALGTLEGGPTLHDETMADPAVLYPYFGARSR
jgi:hypothetical protein